MTAAVAGNLTKAGGLEATQGWAELTEEDKETARRVLAEAAATAKPPRSAAASPESKETKDAAKAAKEAAKAEEKAKKARS